MVGSVMSYIESKVGQLEICSTILHFIIQFKLKSGESCITFENLGESDKTRNDYILITADGGGVGTGPDCFSHLGRKGGEQILNLDRSCLQKELVLHELVHALGNILLLLQH